MDDWEGVARRMLRTEMTSRGVSYKELARALEGLGVTDSSKVIANKVSRGKFSFAFFLQCMSALEVREIRIPDALLGDTIRHANGAKSS